MGAGETGQETFTVQVANSHGATASQTVTITVNGTNDTPVATADSFALNEDGAITFTGAMLTGNDTDVDQHDTLTVSSVSNALHGTVDLNNGNPVFTPTANFSGVAGFDYTISDGNGGTSTAHVTIDIAPDADAPTFTIQNGAPAAVGSDFQADSGFQISELEYGPVQCQRDCARRRRLRHRLDVDDAGLQLHEWHLCAAL